MPARSPPPRRRSPAPVPPAPPRISRRTPPLPGMKRGRSLDRRGGSSGPSRRREFRNGSPPHRRSRSPMRRGEPKGPPPRDFPGMPKRKLSSSPPIKKGRRDGRRPMGSPEMKQTRNKSPLRERGSRSFGDMPGTSGGYSRPLGPEDEGRLTIPNDSGERFRGGVDYEEEAGLDRPIFRGPEGMVRFDPNELKRISIEIVRRNLLPPESQVINRAIVNPEDITPVRRPEMGYGDHMNESLNRTIREPSHHHRSPPRGNDMRPSSPWWNHPSDMPPHNDFNERDHPMGYPNEGSRPIFERDELMNNDRLLAPPVEQRRIVAMPPVRSRSPADRDRSRIRSPGPSREPHGYPYPGDRERSPYDSRAHPRELIDSREKRGDRYHRSDDLRHELDQRRRDEPPHYRPIPPDYREGGGGGYNRPRENESDLRARLSEKRGDPHYKHDERERERERDRERHHDIERERERNRPHRSPPPPNMPPRDRRRGSPDMGPPPPPRTLEREAWERERERTRERERDGDRKRRGRSRERDERRGGGGDASGSRRHSSLERFPEPDLERKDRSYKPDYDYGNDRHLKERDEFTSGPSRGGRGGPAMRRGMPPHAVPRGIPQRFRPPPIGIRVPPPFVPMRGFRPHMMPPPRKSSPEPAFRREKHY